MRYTFFSKDGAEFVRIQVGADAVERAVIDGDKEAADRENAAEDAAQAALEAATKERIAREHANEARARGEEPAPSPSQKDLEKEFDSGLKDELEHKADDDNGKHKKGGKHA